MVKVKCDSCGIEFMKHASHLRYKHIACSRKCYGEIRKKTIGVKKEKTCLSCKSVFITGGRGNLGHKRVFCNRKCFVGFRKNGKMFPCLQCGKQTLRNPGNLKKKVFCSKDCYDKSRTLVYKPVGNAEYKTQRKVMLRDIGKCQRCGYDQYPKILHVHHKDRNRKNNVMENLELLCPNCHEIEHRGIA